MLLYSGGEEGWFSSFLATGFLAYDEEKWGDSGSFIISNVKGNKTIWEH